MDTESVIQRVLAGEREAYEAIVARYQRTLWSLAAYYLHNRTQIAEVVDSTFIKAYFALEQYEAGRGFEPWIKQIARNEIRMLLRKAASERSAAAGYVERLAAQAAIEEFEADHVETMKAHLDGCLARLPGDQKRLIEARYRAERSISEIALDSGRTVDAVKKNLSRIRAVLRVCIEKKVLGHAH